MARKRAATLAPSAAGDTLPAPGAPDDTTDTPLVVFAGGRLDVETAEGLLEQLRASLLETKHGLSIDLADTETAHLAALQILVAAARACDERGEPFRLLRVSDSLNAQILLAGLAGVLGLGDDPLPNGLAAMKRTA